MRYFIREIIYYIIMIYQRFIYRDVQFDFLSKAALSSTFGGMNKLSHHAFFSGELGFASYIGANSVVIGKIGKYCSIGERVHFITKTHPVKEYVSTHPCFYSLKKQCGFTYTDRQLYNEEPLLEGSKYSIEVGNDVYIGFGATLIGPCRIGNGAVIAAGAVVTDDVPDYAVVGGVPAKVIKYRFDIEQIQYLNWLKWWDKSPEWLKRNVTDFQSIEFLKTRIGNGDR